MNYDSLYIINFMRTKTPEKEHAILDAAVKIFSEKGFHKAQVSKIAETAGVAAGTVYLYYKSKDDILLTVFESVWKKLYTDLKNICSDKSALPIDKFDAMIDMLFDVFSDNRPLALVIIHEQNHIERTHPDRFTPYYQKFLNLGEDIMKEGIFHNTFDQNMDPRFFRVFMIGGLRNLIDYWAHHPTSIPMTIIRKNVKSVSKRGILSKHALNEKKKNTV
jgi:TetR/AcrR family transcriptional regulator, fatty acid metabolism regulator protein